MVLSESNDDHGPASAIPVSRSPLFELYYRVSVSPFLYKLSFQKQFTWSVIGGRVR